MKADFLFAIQTKKKKKTHHKQIPLINRFKEKGVWITWHFLQFDHMYNRKQFIRLFRCVFFYWNRIDSWGRLNYQLLANYTAFQHIIRFSLSLTFNEMFFCWIRFFLNIQLAHFFAYRSKVWTYAVALFPGQNIRCNLKRLLFCAFILIPNAP